MSRKSPNRPPMLGTTKLKERGWTPKLIKDFLREPDHTASNPHHRSGPPMKFWLESKVLKVEATDEFLEAKPKAQKRSQSAKANAAQRANELLEDVGKMNVTVKRLPLADVRRLAIADFNAGRRDDTPPASESSDPDFLERIIVNYIRHRLTAYERRLEQVAGKIGSEDAVLAIQSRIFDEIADVYPEFGPECIRQEEKKFKEAPLQGH